MKNIISTFLLIFLAVGFIGCNDDENNASDQTARLQLKLVDAPGDYLEVNVEIIDVLYNSSDDDEGWVSLGTPDGNPVEVDLTELTAGNSLLLTDEIIPSGSLKQIRLVLGENNTLVVEDENGEPSDLIDLDTPSAQQSGLKLKLDAELEAGFTYSFVLDWDVRKSVVKAGNSGKYILKPVINVHADATSGSLEGNVIGKLNAGDTEAVALENVVVEAYDVLDMNESASSTPTDANGNFMFQGLPAGTYVLKIMHSGYQDYESEMDPGIVIEVGVVNVLAESIELLLEDSLKGNVVGNLAADDAQPSALENVTVQLFDSSDLDTEIASTTTDTNGDFAFQGLATASYVLKINHAGYQNYQSDAISVEIDVLKELTESIELLLEP